MAASESTKLIPIRHHHILNDLPDQILPHILSFVDVKLAVQTSVLSRRWRNLWKDISALDLSATSLGATWPSLGPIVAELLESLRSHHGDRSTLITRITFETDPDPAAASLLDSVIQYAATGRRFEDLSIVLRTEKYSVFFRPIADCIIKHRHHGQSLKTLRLEGINFSKGCNDVVASSSSSSDGFSFLTRLELRNCLLADTRPLLCADNFPCLKYLKLIRCTTLFGLAVVSGDQLLELEVVVRHGDAFRLDAVIAPKLRSFSFSGGPDRLKGRIHLRLPSLDRASIRLLWTEPDVERVRNWIDHAFEDFMFGLRNAKSLDLCFTREESWCERNKLLDFLLTATRSSLAVYGFSSFTRLETLKIQYLEEENDNGNDDKVICYRFQDFINSQC